MLFTDVGNVYEHRLLKRLKLKIGIEHSRLDRSRYKYTRRLFTAVKPNMSHDNILLLETR